MTGVAIWLAVLHQAVGALLVADGRLGRACARAPRMSVVTVYRLIRE